jgi:drug/metabolite transporter (DMT)-like permease
MIPGHYIVVLGCGVVYAFSAVAAKRALEKGAGAMQLASASALAMPLSFLPLLLMQPEVPDWSQIHWPLLTGVIAATALVMIYIGFRLGDVSVQGPLAGTKSLFVAVYSGIFLAGGIPWQWWVGAVLTTIGIAWIGLPELRRSRGHMGAVFLALISCAIFGATDLMVQELGQRFGQRPFVMTVFCVKGALIALVLRLMGTSLLKVPAGARTWLAVSALLLGAQAAGFVLMLAEYGDASALNILYGTRGLWTIAVVWIFGRHMGAQERSRGKKILLHRLCGALVLFAAVVLVLLAS